MCIDCYCLITYKDQRLHTYSFFCCPTICVVERISTTYILYISNVPSFQEIHYTRLLSNIFNKWANLSHSSLMSHAHTSVLEARSDPRLISQGTFGRARTFQYSLYFRWIRWKNSIRWTDQWFCYLIGIETIKYNENRMLLRKRACFYCLCRIIGFSLYLIISMPIK